MSKVILYVGLMLLLVILTFTNRYLAFVLAVVLCFGGSLYWCYTRSRHHPDSVDNTPAPISLENAQQQQPTHQLSVSAPMGSDDVRTTIDMHARTTLGRILKPVEDEYSLPTPDTDISPTPYSCLDTDEAVPVKPINEESDTDCHNCALEEQQTYTQSPIVLSADFGDNEVLAIEELACTICLIEYQHGDEIQRNGFSDMSKSCDHIFHPECIATWIRTSCNAECPCCRRPFLVPTPPV
jgi:Ring finger domain